MLDKNKTEEIKEVKEIEKIEEDVKKGVKDQMIIARADNKYICKNGDTFFEISNKEYYEGLKQELEAIEEPSLDELIELGKKYHPYYQKDNAIFNIDTQIAEINQFEQENPIGE